VYDAECQQTVITTIKVFFMLFLAIAGIAGVNAQVLIGGSGTPLWNKGNVFFCPARPECLP
jgi:hypothetical protein